MKDTRYSEEDIKDWEHLPLVLSVLTSSHFGAWLYYRDKRRDKIVNTELLDKLHVKLCDEYFTESNEEWNRAIDRAIEIVKDMKAEVR